MNYHLSQVGDLPDKTKCDVILRLLTCEMKTGKASGKTYWNGKVADVQNPAITLYASFFGNSPSALIGQDLIVTGMEKGSYNGKAQLSASKFSKYNEYVADLEAAVGEPLPPPPPYRPATQPARQSQQNRPAMPPGGELKVNLPHPACVGACVNKAVEIWIATIGKDGPWTDDSQDTVHMIASDLIRVHAKLEAGEIQPSAPGVPF